MDQHAFTREILALAVWDTHTHLTPDQLPAQSFWDIGHYFWFLRELQAAGYPQRPGEIPEPERIDAYLEAFRATRNTSMNWVVRHILSELYQIELTGPESILAADQAIRRSAADPTWPRQVTDRLSIQRICIHAREPTEYENLAGVSSVVPIDANLRWTELIDRTAAAPDTRAAAEKASGEVYRAVERLAQNGITCTRAPEFPFCALDASAYQDPALGTQPTRPQIELYLAHKLYRALDEHAMVAQLFIGVEPTTAGERIGVDDVSRIPNLHGLFDRYSTCRFELIVGAEGNNLDAVQAARVYRNVHVGGMWWYNFRASTYRQSMQYRLEALPSRKCSLVVSDARSIEWCFGKILLVKHLIAEFLWDQIERGWLDGETALRVARDWLHDSASALYTGFRS